MICNLVYHLGISELSMSIGHHSVVKRTVEIMLSVFEKTISYSLSPEWISLLGVQFSTIPDAISAEITSILIACTWVGGAVSLVILIVLVWTRWLVVSIYEALKSNGPSGHIKGVLNTVV